MKKTIWIVVVVVIIIVIIGISSSGTSNQKASTQVGVLLSLSGDVAVTGEKLDRGIELASADLKSQGIEFNVQDTHSKPADAISAAQQLMTTGKADVFIGPYIPEEAIALSPIALKKKISIFALAYCTPSFAPLSNVFCAYPTASLQLDTIMPVFKEKNVKTVALVDTNTDFGIDSDKTMKAKAAPNGYEVVSGELVKAGERNFRTVISKIMPLSPDAVFMAADNPTDAITFMKQLYEAGYKGVRVTFIDVDNKNLQGFGQSVEGIYAPGIAPSKFSKTFTDAYRAKYNADPDYPSAMAWDVAHYIAQTLKENGGNTSSLNTDILKTEYKNPAISNFKYLPDRTIQYDLEVNIVKGETYVPL
jgi:branched-chain amino acid transport system substrate-binding protein